MTEERRRVLLVEDSPTQAARLRAFLEAESLDVIHADSAEAALEILNTAGVDIVVLDYHLPGMDGSEFCRGIRMNVNTRALPVLMLTVEGGDAAQLVALNSGADDYLEKTADPAVLRVRVQALLRKSQGSGPILDIENRFSRVRVLAIDDSATYRHRLAEELRADHYIVDVADSATKGLAMARAAAYDCLLVDFDLSDADGAQVCRSIREAHPEPGSGPVVIVLTSHEDTEHMTLGFIAGADDYIPKSADIAVIKARVRALLRRKFLVDENRHILNELKEKELEAIRATAARESAELRAQMADQLAEANRELERVNRNLDLANKELEQFAFSAAHDLQEPLRMIGIYSQLLQTRYGDAMDATASQYVSFCVEGARRMDQLIKGLLDYARATQKSDAEAMDRVDLDLVLERALANLQGVLQETKAEIVRGSLPSLCIEEIRIQQLLQNLIGNALKYRRKDATPRVEVGAERREDEWLFFVADNGIGIEPEHQATVFGAFKRLHSKGYSGTGLGLAICQRIVQHYGGRIWVESVPGRGSTFYFTLPSRLEKSARAASAAQRRP
jgi:two-component system NtrC family sensor kinase